MHEPGMDDSRRPDVVLDIVMEDERAWLVLSNFGPTPALRVRVQFDGKVPGPDGRNAARLALFRKLEYLAPGRSIRVFVGTREGFLRHLDRNLITARVRWTDRAGRRFSDVMSHDISVYRDLPVLLDFHRQGGP